MKAQASRGGSKAKTPAQKDVVKASSWKKAAAKKAAARKKK